MRRALLALVFGACFAREGPVPAADYGATLFADPGFSPSRFNAFSCETCHGARPEVPGEPRIGRSLYNAAFRRSFWGGQKARLLDAVNFCLIFFMRGEPLAQGDARGRALYEYLVRISPERPSTALPLTVVENVADVPRGETARGRAVYAGICRGCHGEPHTGAGRLSELVSVIPESSQEFAARAGVPAALVVVEKVRHGQFFGVGGNMPLFSREALADADLGAILSYLGL